MEFHPSATIHTRMRAVAVLFGGDTLAAPA